MHLLGRTIYPTTTTATTAATAAATAAAAAAATAPATAPAPAPATITITTRLGPYSHAYFNSTKHAKTNSFTSQTGQKHVTNS